MEAVASAAEPVVRSPDILGESPLWDWRTERLFWVDVRAPALRSLDPSSGRTRSWPMPEIVSAVMLRAAGGLVVGLRSGLHTFNPDTAALEMLHPIDEPQHEGNRVNDCKVDRSGALWWSTMWDFGLHTTGSLYRLHPDGTNETIRTDITVPNGLCFDPGGERGHFADTATGRLETFRIRADGSVGDWRELGGSLDLPGRPDGSACDARGYVWNARYGGGAVACIAPSGELAARIDLPTSQPSCCAFGGSDLRTLFVTTSRQKLSDVALAREPMAGALLRVPVEHAGQREPAFAG